jgi:hypothetical protein
VDSPLYRSLPCGFYSLDQSLQAAYLRLTFEIYKNHVPLKQALTGQTPVRGTTPIRANLHAPCDPARGLNPCCPERLVGIALKVGADQIGLAVLIHPYCLQATKVPHRPGLDVFTPFFSNPARKSTYNGRGRNHLESVLSSVSGKILSALNEIVLLQCQICRGLWRRNVM